MHCCSGACEAASFSTRPHHLTEGPRHWSSSVAPGPTKKAEVTCHGLDLEVGPRGVGVREGVAHLGDDVLCGERPSRDDDAFLCLKSEACKYFGSDHVRGEQGDVTGAGADKPALDLAALAAEGDNDGVEDECPDGAAQRAALRNARCRNQQGATFSSRVKERHGPEVAGLEQAQHAAVDAPTLDDVPQPLKAKAGECGCDVHAGGNGHVS
eukprot:3744321-Pyramimonas_sp.AAC.1